MRGIVRVDDDAFGLEALQIIKRIQLKLDCVQALGNLGPAFCDFRQPSVENFPRRANSEAQIIVTTLPRLNLPLALDHLPGDRAVANGLGHVLSTSQLQKFARQAFVALQGIRRAQLVYWRE